MTPSDFLSEFESSEDDTACPQPDCINHKAESSEVACSEARHSQVGNEDLGILMTVTQDPEENYSSNWGRGLVWSPTDADKVARSAELLAVDGDCWL